VVDGEIVQIIDYQAYLTATFPCIFRKILWLQAVASLLVVTH